MTKVYRELKTRIYLDDVCDITCTCLNGFSHNNIPNRSERNAYCVITNPWPAENFSYRKDKKINPMIPDNPASRIRQLMQKLDELDLIDDLQKMVARGYSGASQIKLEKNKYLQFTIDIYCSTLLEDVIGGFTHEALVSGERDYRIWHIKHECTDSFFNNFTRYYDEFFEAAKKRLSNFLGSL